jgi:hypothetical protein
MCTQDFFIARTSTLRAACHQHHAADCRRQRDEHRKPKDRSQHRLPEGYKKSLRFFPRWFLLRWVHAGIETRLSTTINVLSSVSASGRHAASPRAVSGEAGS